MINGLKIANFLRNHPKVLKVQHPLFEDFPGHDIMMKQTTGYTGVFSFYVKSYVIIEVKAF